MSKFTASLFLTTLFYVSLSTERVLKPTNTNGEIIYLIKNVELLKLSIVKSDMYPVIIFCNKISVRPGFLVKDVLLWLREYSSYPS